MSLRALFASPPGAILTAQSARFQTFSSIGSAKYENDVMFVVARSVQSVVPIGAV